MTEVPQALLGETSPRGAPSQPDPDLLLLRAVANGSRHALSTLYEQHGQSILIYITGQLEDRQLAEEVLQDVMLAVWNSAGSFRGESKVKTWLLAIARMKVLDIWRKRRPQTIELDDELSGDDDNLLRRVEKFDEMHALRQALKQLPDEQKETLELVFYHELSGVEAAQLLGVSPGTVKSRLHRAKQTLRGLLQRKEVE